MEEHKSVTVQVDKAAGKIYVDGVLPNATLCLYHIRGKVIEVKQAREESASFDLPCSGEYVLVITHALSVPVGWRKVNCVMRCFSFKLIGRGSASAKGVHQHSRRA